MLFVDCNRLKIKLIVLYCVVLYRIVSYRIVHELYICTFCCFATFSTWQLNPFVMEADGPLTCYWWHGDGVNEPVHQQQLDWPTLRVRFVGPTWGPSGADRTKLGPMVAPWTLPSGKVSWNILVSAPDSVVALDTSYPMWLVDSTDKEPVLRGICRYADVIMNGWVQLIWWRHAMEMPSALLSLCVGNPPVTDGEVDPPYKGLVTQTTLMFPLL